MRWPWSKRPKLPLPNRLGVSVTREPLPPRNGGIVVEEHDTSAMSQTGVHKAWNRLTKRQG